MQANYKISAMRILYELHSLKQRRAYMIIRAEIEEKHRQRVETEVREWNIVMLTLNCGNLTTPATSAGQCWSQWQRAGALAHSPTLTGYFITSNLQVRKLRENISDLKVQVSSITKGIPISQWDILAGRWVRALITQGVTLITLDISQPGEEEIWRGHLREREQSWEQRSDQLPPQLLLQGSCLGDYCDSGIYQALIVLYKYI